ncbi:hypothetical protein QWY74_07350 [Halomonas almeriensis]|uniref:hypothetical protein n=1 Tax=Halomonas almeriensis TaxID=308163 RepID=UPI0025B2A005|nr:hypothetical protein [Halomonas almeriensis]MDN3553277.1 hypothetical protein [Halomonas almeriensis]
MDDALPTIDLDTPLELDTTLPEIDLDTPVELDMTLPDIDLEPPSIDLVLPTTGRESEDDEP